MRTMGRMRNNNNQAEETAGVAKGGGRQEGGSATTTSQINCKHGKKAAPGEMKRLVK